jgi:hypothetical protein
VKPSVSVAQCARLALCYAMPCHAMPCHGMAWHGERVILPDGEDQPVPVPDHACQERDAGDVLAVDVVGHAEGDQLLAVPVAVHRTEVLDAEGPGQPHEGLEVVARRVGDDVPHRGALVDPVDSHDQAEDDDEKEEEDGYGLDDDNHGRLAMPCLEDDIKYTKSKTSDKTNHGCVAG